MKIEKIAENTVRVTLLTVELQKWHVSYENLSSDSPEVCTMFRDIIRRINETTGTDFSGQSLSVEVMRTDKDTMVMIMTGKNVAKGTKYHYRIRQKSKKAVSMIYFFPGIDEFIDFAKNNLYYCLLFNGKNSLYRIDNKVSLVLTVPGELRSFLPGFNDRISEYAEISVCSDLWRECVSEHKKPIIGNEALKTVYYKL